MCTTTKPGTTSRWRSEQGFSFVFVGLTLMAFLAATMLAIDVGMLMTARAQAQKGRQHGREDLQVANLVAFFIENMQGKDVVGRLVPSTGLIRGNAGPAPAGAFLRAIQLVQ